MPTEYNAKEYNTSAERKKLPKWVKIIIGVLIGIALLVGIAIWAVSASTKDAVAVSDQFITDMQANNASAAYKLTGPIFQKATSESQLKDIFDSASPDLQGSKRITGKSIRSEGKQRFAAIVYTIETSSGKRYARVVVQMDGDAWKVANIRTSEQPLDAAEID
jgi:hypothetical protein